MTRSRHRQPESADACLSPEGNGFARPASVRTPFTGTSSGQECRIFPTPWSANRKVQRAADRLPAGTRRIPASGSLRPVLEAALASHRAPAQVLLAQVSNAWFERNPDGVSFGLRVVYQGVPVELAPPELFEASHPRPSYAPDLGLAATEEGLVVSAMTIRDAKGSEQFRTGKRPTYGLIPWDQAQHIGELLESLPVAPRSVTLDTSLIPNLSDELRQATRQLHRSLRRRCTGGAVAYRKTSSVGEENRTTRDRCKATGLATGWQLRRLMTEVGLECPHCGALALLKADPKTGAPLRSRERCGLCRRDLSVGRLLADRARTRGIHSWLENLSGPSVAVAGPVHPPVAKSYAGSACAATSGRKALRGASAKECALVRSPHKAEVPSTRPSGAKSVTPTTAKFGSPSLKVLSARPSTHVTGLVRRTPRQDGLVRLSAPSRLRSFLRDIPTL